MDWLIEFAWKDCIAATGVAATVAGIVVAVRVSRLKSRTHSDQQYFIGYSKRYQELIAQAPGDVRYANRDALLRTLKARDMELAEVRAFWIKAAENALDGNMSALRAAVDVARMREADQLHPGD
jgi:hypothetical protein